MKRLILSLLLAPSGLYAASPCILAAGAPGLSNTFYGATNCSGGAVDTITVYGDLDVQGTQINTATVHGELDINQGAINVLVSKGIVQAHDSTFGAIVATGNVELYNSSAQSIEIKSVSSLSQAIVKLSDGASAGSITFESGKGLVIESDGATVNGTVTGGQIQTQP